MAQYLIVTDNPLVKENVELDINYCESLDEVMITTRDLVHSRYKLITHPLSGSVKPVQSPYKSIILQKIKNNKLNYKSLRIIESAITKVEQFKKNYTDRDYPKEVLKDYQTIDFSLLQSGLEKI
ncbi:GrdX family protein [Acetohalobium arabaticum]|uniref:Component of glycine reductase complex n=1 Tax=Acetohalobium arabaticum (strain ATCC 49924 / DSM 5501 / Z-7288) TaxID=574087 RepID=D9QPS5_ACEAZ|nr:GrdX family protein [Acetohalobium arabaticum]ADL12516.1 component of glycine reductase complex [Acetohalobium arabaticum DSM 5501]